jgi:hypothetical protein
MDHLRYEGHSTDQERNKCEQSDVQASVAGTAHRVTSGEDSTSQPGEEPNKNYEEVAVSRTVRRPTTPTHRSLLRRLKEEDRLPWKQIKEHFPGRTEGSLQVRYSTKHQGSSLVVADINVE